MIEKNILHRIKAYLYDNCLTDDPNDFTARVVSEQSLSIGQICEMAVKRGGSDISAASMKHAVELFLKEMGYQLCDGFSVNTGCFTAMPMIKGVFNSPKETFNPGKHSVLFQFNQGEALRQQLPGIQVEILGVAESVPSIAQVTDVKTGSVNDLLTPNRNLKIAGHKLKIAGDNPANGIYFVNQASGERVPVEASDIVTNNPSELMIVIPALNNGTYKLEVTTQFTIGTMLKAPRTAVFDKVLSVQLVQ